MTLDFDVYTAYSLMFIVFAAPACLCLYKIWKYVKKHNPNIVQEIIEDFAEGERGAKE